MRSIYYLIIGIVLGLIGLGLINITNDARYALISAIGVVLEIVACIKLNNE